MPADTSARKQRGRPFKKGKSGNPAGRPPGVRNQATILAEKLMADDVQGVVETVIREAKAGDMTACRLVLERLVPARKDSPVTIKLPKIETADDAVIAMSILTNALADGELTPTEATAISSLIEGFRKIIETVELEARIAALESDRGQA